jgi:hypothetical protein
MADPLGVLPFVIRIGPGRLEGIVWHPLSVNSAARNGKLEVYPLPT